MLQQEYVDIANFDHYDMIIGMPFMHSRTVILDFENDVVRIGNKSIPAVKVLVPDLDNHVHQYHTTEKKQEWLHGKRYAMRMEEVQDEEPQVWGGVLSEEAGVLLQLNEEYSDTLKQGQVDPPVPKMQKTCTIKK